MPCVVCRASTKQTCSGCHDHHICSRKCQKHDWSSHKLECGTTKGASKDASNDASKDASNGASMDTSNGASDGGTKDTMMMKKKKKGGGVSHHHDCAECGAPEGTVPTMMAHLPCARCLNAFYCSRACQVAHWKGGGHRRRCLPPHERSVKRASGGRSERAAEECAICLNALNVSAICTLPCTHRFHASCVDEYRAFGVRQLCPMCREEMPPDAETLFVDGCALFFPMRIHIMQLKNYCGPEVDNERPKLNKKQAKTMEEVKRLWRGAAAQGHARAQHNVGQMYQLTKDFAQALEFYKMAAQQGLPTSQLNLGIMYDYGRPGVQQNFAKAVKWYEKAVASSDPELSACALCNLGVMYEGGPDRDGLEKNDAKAVECYEVAAMQFNCPNSQFNLANMYEKGLGVEPDLLKAAMWFELAVKQGEKDAADRLVRVQFNMACMYLDAEGGVEQDLTKAMRLFLTVKASLQCRPTIRLQMEGGRDVDIDIFVREVVRRRRVETVSAQ